MIHLLPQNQGCYLPGPFRVLKKSFRVCSMLGTPKFWAAKMPVQVPRITPKTAEDRSLDTIYPAKKPLRKGEASTLPPWNNKKSPLCLKHTTNGYDVHLRPIWQFDKMYGKRVLLSAHLQTWSITTTEKWGIVWGHVCVKAARGLCVCQTSDLWDPSLYFLLHTPLNVL